MAPPSLAWFQLDLRLSDHAALRAACQRGGPVVPVFIWHPQEEAPWPAGAASKWWLHQSLRRLDESLRTVGSRLIVRRGPALKELIALARETGAEAVFWSRRYEPAAAARDSKLVQALEEVGLRTGIFPGALLREPSEIRNQSGFPFRVFTPFWRRCLQERQPSPPLPSPDVIPPPARWPSSLPLDSLGLEPQPDWAAGFRSVWAPGEKEARDRLQRFLSEAVLRYAEDRNRPDLPGTSRLSPHLHFGEITPRQVWHHLRRFAKAESFPQKTWQGWQFVSELGWREFAHHLLHHFPHTPAQPLRQEFARFPWRVDGAWLKAWQRGRTGYPLVDAGMRELWATGWMHNRVRMVVASFLVKHLQISWTEGAAWFWDTLVDADLANNTLGWQWTAGCGADAAPYFRVFNPVAQGEKFDPRGTYARRWIPELAGLPDHWIHQPWKAPAAALAKAGLELGKTYPRPIVNHGIAREVALEAYASISKKGA